MNPKRNIRENGQSLVIIALGIVAFVAMLALVIDGANAYAAKRQAQNAADAGALAGATAMCTNYSESDGRTSAIEYVDNNGAVVENPTSDVYVEYHLANPTVEVTATLSRNTFFAGIIGFSQVTVRARAIAKCEPIVGMGVLPVAWACRKNTLGSGVVLPGIDCTQKIYNVNCFDKYNGSCTYVLMDSVKVAKNNKGGKCDPSVTIPTDPKYCYCDPNITNPGDPRYCQPEDLVCSAHLDYPTCEAVEPNTTDCDINNDCVDELMLGGSRAWLDLNGGGGGAAELTNWIKNGFPDPIPPHKWIPEEAGVATSIFHTAASYVVGKEVTLPVFDTVCDKFPYIPVSVEQQAACTYGPIPPDDLSLASNGNNYHIISFAAFHVTCVQTGKNKIDSEPGYVYYDKNGNIDIHGKDCSGHLQAVANNSIDDNDKTIEGYFTKLMPGGYGGEGSLVDTGTFTVVLVKSR